MHQISLRPFGRGSWASAVITCIFQWTMQLLVRRRARCAMEASPESNFRKPEAWNQKSCLDPGFQALSVVSASNASAISQYPTRQHAYDQALSRFSRTANSSQLMATILFILSHHGQCGWLCRLGKSYDLSSSSMFNIAIPLSSKFKLQGRT